MPHELEHIFHTLHTHVAIDTREQESVQKFFAVVPHLSDPCNEHADNVHVTASAIVVADHGGKVALHLHKRLNMWLQPGGHIEKGETPAQGALREAQEETGLPVRHHHGDGVFFHIDVHPGPKGHTHVDLRYLVRAPEVDPSPADGESDQVAWFSWDEALAMADAGLVGGLHAAKALLGME